MDSLKSPEKLYSEAFTNIQNSYNTFLIIVGVFVAIVGIFVAIFVGVIAYYNRKAGKNLEKEFSEINKKISDLEKDLKKRAVSQNSEFDNMKEDFEKIKKDFEDKVEAVKDEFKKELESQKSEFEETNKRITGLEEKSKKQLENQDGEFNNMKNLFNDKIKEFKIQKNRDFLRNDHFYHITLNKVDKDTIDVIDEFQNEFKKEKMVDYLSEFYKRLAHSHYFDWWKNLTIEQKRNCFREIINQVDGKWGERLFEDEKTNSKDKG